MCAVRCFAGRTRVLEQNHIVVLNWSNKVVPLLKELCLANESEGGACIAVLSPLDKEDMERKLQEAEFDRLGSRIVCRSGDPTIVADLNQVGLVCLVAATKEAPVMFSPTHTSCTAMQTKPTKLTNHCMAVWLWVFLQVSPHWAKAIVVLSPSESTPDDSDAKSLRAVLSLLQIMDPRLSLLCAALFFSCAFQLLSAANQAPFCGFARRTRG